MGVFFLGSQLAIADCGDGFIDFDEECDDGNSADDDTCSNSCTYNEICGDGVLLTDECDDGNNEAGDGCEDCRFVTTCGDGIFVKQIEACDDGNLENNDGCNSTCISENCGDGIQQPSEACDDGNRLNSDQCDVNCHTIDPRNEITIGGFMRDKKLGSVLNGFYLVAFRYYDHEDQSLDERNGGEVQMVNFLNGFFQTSLDIEPNLMRKNLFIGIQPLGEVMLDAGGIDFVFAGIHFSEFSWTLQDIEEGGKAFSGIPELLPRIQYHPVPYSVIAYEAKSLDSTYLASLFGDVSTSELGFIDGATSNIQDQIDSLSGLSDSGSGNAATADALSTNPSDCSAGQFANAIAANGNLTCEAISVTTITGNAGTATALAANPTDCGAGEFANAIAASGNLTCAAVTTITGNAATSTALAANPTDCAGGQFATSIDASGNLTCGAPGNATTATALAANGANCAAGQYPLGVDASGATETCTADDDTPDSDAEVPNDITIASTSAASFASTLNVTGATALATTLGVTGASTFTGVSTYLGTVIYTPTASQNIAVAATIAANARVVQITPAGSFTLTATPIIIDGTDGQIITIVNVGANTATLSDQTTTPNTNLRLGAATRALGPVDNITFVYSSTVGDWVEIGFTNVQ